MKYPVAETLEKSTTHNTGAISRMPPFIPRQCQQLNCQRTTQSSLLTINTTEGSIFIFGVESIWRVRFRALRRHRCDGRRNGRFSKREWKSGVFSDVISGSCRLFIVVSVFEFGSVKLFLC